MWQCEDFSWADPAGNIPENLHEVTIMADIFISYAREDLERVRPIVRLIEAAGWSVFWDRTIPAGMTWRQHIGRALDEANGRNGPVGIGVGKG
jgi:hypothetical protein